MCVIQMQHGVQPLHHGLPVCHVCVGYESVFPRGNQLMLAWFLKSIQKLTSLSEAF